MLAVVFLAAQLALGQSNKQYLIVAKGQGSGSTAFAANIRSAGGTVLGNLPEIGVVIASSSDPRFSATLSADPNVQGVSEDPEIMWLPKDVWSDAGPAPSPDGVNSEPAFGLQWNIRQINADKTAAAGIMGNEVTRARVAVLDAGMAVDHPELAPNVNLGLSGSFVPGEGVEPVGTGFNHGTHVAGIIAAAINNQGVQGVAPKAELVAVKVLRESGAGSFGWLIEGLVYAAAIHADVANMSLGATFDGSRAHGSPNGPLLAALNRAITYA